MPALLCSFSSAVGGYSGASFFFFNDTATTEIYTLSLHDALPISRGRILVQRRAPPAQGPLQQRRGHERRGDRSEEHTSELQSPCNLVCRLLLEKKKKRLRQRQRPVDRRDRPESDD